MGMDNYIEKVNNGCYKTVEELNNRENYFGSLEEMFCYRKHYWLDNFFRQKCKNSEVYDEVILTKEDVELLIKEIKTALITDCSNFNKGQFFNDDIEYELNSVLRDMRKLLKEDFEKNTYYYNSSC